MEKLILSDKTEIKVKPGASLGNITALVTGFTELGTVADALMVNGNLDVMQFTSDEAVTSEYSEMKLISPLFQNVDIQVDGSVIATFALREKTELERQLDRIESKQQLQDGAIEELGEAVSTLAEGGMA